MEKYCKSCGRVFYDINFKLCPYCGGYMELGYGIGSVGTCDYESELNVVESELKVLEKQLEDAEKKLTNAVTEDEKIDYQFKIIKLNEVIPHLKHQKTNISKIKKDKIRKIKLFKKLYVEYDNELLDLISKHYSINYDNKDALIKFLVENFSQKEIDDVTTKIKVYQNTKESKLAKKQGLKTCPHCGKKILKNAIRCRFCRTMLK